MFGSVPYSSVQRSSINVIVEIVKNGYIVRYAVIKKKPNRKDEDDDFVREELVEEAVILQTEEEIIELFRQLKAQIGNR